MHIDCTINLQIITSNLQKNKRTKQINKEDNDRQRLAVSKCKEPLVLELMNQGFARDMI